VRGQDDGGGRRREPEDDEQYRKGAFHDVPLVETAETPSCARQTLGTMEAKIGARDLPYQYSILTVLA
jgi:hypothetical protein